MVETLSRNLEEYCRMEHLARLTIIRGIKEKNHSQFVDDTLLLGVASSIIERRFKTILDQFLSASGGKINTLKSQIYGQNLSENRKSTLLRILDFMTKDH
jgi:hypothetical protein